MKNKSKKISLEQIKGFSAKQALRLIGQIIKRISPKQLAKLLYLLELIAPDKDTRNAVGLARKEFDKKGNWSQLVQKFFKEINPKCREKFIQNLIVNQAFEGKVKRKAFAHQEGFEPPWFILISPTMRCNLNCVGCSTREYSFKNDWSEKLTDRVLNEAKEMGMYFVVTLGGETLIKEDIFDVFKKHNDMYFLIYTNGTLIDEKMAKKLAQVGNVALAISVEGFEKETDARRGKGVWKKILRATEVLKKEGVCFGFSTTMTKQNTNIVCSEKFIDFFIKKGCLFGWYFQYIPVGKNPDINLMPTPVQREKLRKFVHHFCRKTKPILIGDFWNDGPYAKGCLAGGRTYLHVNNDGNVEPCGFVHFATDNIKDKSLKEILNSKFFKEIRKKQQTIDAPESYSDNLLTPCLIIDQPWVLREIVKKCGAFSTHEGAETIIKDPKIIRHLNQYSKKLHQIEDPIWEKEYCKNCQKYKKKIKE